MKCKKIITIIIATLLILLPMMTTPTQAMVSKVYNLKADITGRGINFTWDKVTGVDGYNLYINTENNGYEFIGSVSGTKASVVGFETNKTYKAKICAYELDKNGNKVEGTASKEVIVNYANTLEKTLSKVQNINIKQEGKYIRLNWNQVSNATGYYIYVNLPGFGYMNIGHVTSNSVFINGGRVGETYDFKVCAYKQTKNGLEYGETSNSVCITFKNEEESNYKIAQVTGVKVTNVTENLVKIMWNSAKNATNYDVYLAKENGAFKYISNTKNTYITISELKSDTSYKIIVVSKDNNQNYGINSQVVKFTTNKDYKYETPNQVKNLTVKVVDKTSAELKWTKVSKADGYDIYVAEGNGNFRYKKSTSDVNYTLKNLEYNTTYSVKVCAYRNFSGRELVGEFSTVKTFTTGKDTVDNIRGFNVEVINRNEAYVSWWLDNTVDGYEVWVAEDGYSFKKELETEECNCILYELEYLTDYDVKVRAFKYKNGRKEYGNFTSTKSFTTKKYNKYENSPNVSKVTNVKYQVVGDTVYLNWNKVSGVAGYEISLTMPGLGGATIMKTNTNSRIISGLTEKEDKYTVRIRAYKIVNGIYQYGNYSEVVKFAGK